VTAATASRPSLVGWGRTHLVLATLAFGAGLCLLVPAVLARATHRDAERQARERLGLGDAPAESLAPAARERLDFAIDDAQLELIRREQSDLAGGTGLVLASIPLSILGGTLIAGRWLAIPLVLSFALAMLALLGAFDLYGRATTTPADVDLAALMPPGTLPATGPTARAGDDLRPTDQTGPGRPYDARLVADAALIATGVLGGTTCWATARALWTVHTAPAPPRAGTLEKSRDGV